MAGRHFNAAARHNGALTLLYLLGDGLKAKSEREATSLQKAIESGSDEEDARGHGVQRTSGQIFDLRVSPRRGTSSNADAQPEHRSSSAG